MAYSSILICSLILLFLLRSAVGTVASTGNNCNYNHRVIRAYHRCSVQSYFFALAIKWYLLEGLAPTRHHCDRWWRGAVETIVWTWFRSLNWWPRNRKQATKLCVMFRTHVNMYSKFVEWNNCSGVQEWSFKTEGVTSTVCTLFCVVLVLDLVG